MQYAVLWMSLSLLLVPAESGMEIVQCHSAIMADMVRLMRPLRLHLAASQLVRRCGECVDECAAALCEGVVPLCAVLLQPPVYNSCCGVCSTTSYACVNPTEPWVQFVLASVYHVLLVVLLHMQQIVFGTSMLACCTFL